MIQMTSIIVGTMKMINIIGRIRRKVKREKMINMIKIIVSVVVKVQIKANVVIIIIKGINHVMDVVVHVVNIKSMINIMIVYQQIVILVIIVDT